MSSAAVARTRTIAAQAMVAWPLALGFAVLAVPTAISFAREQWTRDYGEHEPFILIVGGWLLWRNWPQIRGSARPGAGLRTLTALLVALPVYVFGRAYDFPTLEGLGLYGVGLALLNARLGFRALGEVWFPLLFLLFGIPPPHALLDSLTAPLKELVSALATSVLQLLGLPVARQGVVIFVAQYELLVEDACSGMNSLIGLTALSVLYGYIRRGASVRDTAFMISLAVPVAIAANIIRVALLVLITYLFGDSVAQGFLHFAAGIVLFLTALGLVFAIDKAAHHFLARGKGG